MSHIIELAVLVPDHLHLGALSTTINACVPLSRAREVRTDDYGDLAGTRSRDVTRSTCSAIDLELLLVGWLGFEGRGGEVGGAESLRQGMAEPLFLCRRLEKHPRG